LEGSVWKAQARNAQMHPFKAFFFSETEFWRRLLSQEASPLGDNWIVFTDGACNPEFKNWQCRRFNRFPQVIASDVVPAELFAIRGTLDQACLLHLMDCCDLDIFQITFCAAAALP